MYGIRDLKETSFTRNGLLARRLVERGVRFVPLYDTNWDHHDGVAENLEKHLPDKARNIDQRCAVPDRDLQQLGLLDDTIVSWAASLDGPSWAKSANPKVATITSMPPSCGSREAVLMEAKPLAERTSLVSELSKNHGHVRDIHATMLH